MTQTPASHNRPEDHEIDLKLVINLVKNSYILVIIITFFFLIGGIYYAEKKPAVYRSVAMLDVGGDISGGLSSGSESSVTALKGLLSNQASSADVETVLLRSPYVLGRVVRDLGMDISVSPHYTGFFNRKLARFRASPGNATVSFLSVPDSLLAKPLTLVVRNHTQYSLFTKKGIKILDGVVGKLAVTRYFGSPLKIQVTALHAKPNTKFDVTKQAVSTVVKSISRGLSIKEEGNGTNILALSYISGNPKQAQKLLSKILAIAVQKNEKEKLQDAAKTLQFIKKQLPISKADLKKSETKLEKYSVKSGVFDPGSEGSTLEGSLDRLQTSLDLLKFKKMMLLERFTSIYPSVIAVTKKEQQINQEINRRKAMLEKLPVTGEKEEGMKRDAIIQSEIYTALVENAQNMEMMEASMVSNVQVLSSASYPTSRIPVNKLAIVFSSVFLGLIFSLAIIFIRHMLSPIIEDPDVVERIIGIAVSAIIPFSQKQMSHNKKCKLDKLYANKTPFLLTKESPSDISIEGIRSLRTAMQMSLLEAANNVIAITGCSPGVGKSFVSSNLAALFADLGKRVLLIDLDIRLGKLYQSVGKTKSPGISTYLANQATREQIMQNVVPGKLDFIATGLYPDNPSELLSQSALADLIEEMKSQYDLVILDTPPILAVTDSALILRYAATNLMVLGVGKDQMKEVIYAKKTLEKAGVVLTGLVFNTLKQQKSGFGHNYGYANYHYTYGK